MASSSAINVAFATDSRYVDRVRLALHGLLTHAQRLVRVTILHDGLDAREREAPLARCALHGATLRLLQVDTARLPVFPDRGSRAAYFRLLLPEMLPVDERKVLYLDADVLCRGDIGPMWDTDLGGFGVAAVREVNSRWSENSRWPGAFRFRHAVRSLAAADYFNSGVMLINVEKWRTVNLADSVLECQLSRSTAIPLTCLLGFRR